MTSYVKVGISRGQMPIQMGKYQWAYFIRSPYMLKLSDTELPNLLW